MGLYSKQVKLMLTGRKSKKIEEIKSIEEFRITYYPVSTEKDRLMNLSPEEWGAELAQKAINQLKELLSKKD